VIDNIIINAQQAMPAGGTITVSARNDHIGPAQTLAAETMCASVSATGHRYSGGCAQPHL
jgi:signal transduction histidine kinase